MNAKTSLKLALLSIIIPAISIANAADPAEGEITVSGEITPKLYFFDYLKEAGADRIQFLERYNYQEGLDDDRRSGFYLDADLNLTIANPERNLLTLERVGFGPHNHRGNAQGGTDKIGYSAFYSRFRSATGGIDYLYGPNQVAGGTDPSYNVPANTNSGYVAQFNDDSGQSLYKVDRSTYGAGLKLKPELLGNSTSVALDYDGYKRTGNSFSTYALGGSDVQGTNFVLQRWRGFNQDVNENMNRVSFKFAATPGDLLQVAYDVSLEKFDNQARAFTHGDIVFPAGNNYNPANDATRPLGFVPDSNLITNGLRLSRNFGNVAVAAGFGHSVLEQDSFTRPQQLAGYNTGKITTDNAFLNVNTNIFSSASLDGFVKYYSRVNDSSFPVGTYISDVASERLGVRVNGIDSLSYGFSTTFRTAMLKSTITPGWKHEDKSRDLTFHQGTVVPPVNGITSERSLYREDTESDELFVKLISRPIKGVTVRVTPSYLQADKTGLVTEPEKAFGLNTKVAYATPTGMLVSGFYDYKNKINDNISFLGTDGALVTQDTEKTLQSAGGSLNLPVSEWINTSVSLSWFQDDYETFYFRTNRRRFEAPVNPVIFYTQDRPNYNIDTYVFSVGGDWQFSDVLRYNGSYTFSRSKGDTASGVILAALPAVDGQINNSIHSLAVGAEYAFKKTMKFRGSYIYDYYTDEVYAGLTGGVHTFMFGVAVGF